MKSSLLVSTESMSSAYEKLSNELLPSMKAKGLVDGKNKRPGSEQEFNVLILGPVTALIQSAIDENQRYYTPIAGRVIATRIRHEADLKIEEFKRERDTVEIDIKTIESKRKECQPDMNRRAKRKYVAILEGCAGVLEGYFMYESFVSMGLIPIISIFIAGLLAVVVGFGFHVIARFLRRSTSRLNAITRYACVLLPVGIAFVFLGITRALAYNNAGQYSSLIKQENLEIPAISAWNLTLISLLLFTLILMISVFYSKTDEEAEMEKCYDNLTKELEEAQGMKNSIERSIAQIEKEAEELSAQALINYEKALAEENRFLALWSLAITTYKEANTRIRPNDSIPAFFAKDLKPTDIKIFFQSINRNNHETD